MTINQRQTVYRRDYVWPNTKGLSTLHPIPNIEVFCLCKCPANKVETSGPGPVPAPGQNPMAENNVEQGWSRIGPMGSLIDPKLYPAHVGAAPQSDVSRFNQPNVFLDKIHDDYPLMFECEERAPRADFVARVNRDRMRTTYQVDFCNRGAPFTYQNLINTDDYGTYPPPQRLPGDSRRNKEHIEECGAKHSHEEYKNAGAAVKANQMRCMNLKVCKGGGLSATTGNTEYQDRISRMANKHKPAVTTQ